MIEELRDFLRGLADNPGRAIAPLWTMLWLWSVVRGWLKRMREAREQREAEAHTLPPPPPPPPAKPTPPARVPEPPPPPSLGPWPQLIERAEALRLHFSRERALRWLEPIVISEVLEPFRAALARSKSASVVPEQDRRAAAARMTLQALEQVARERRTDEAAAWLAELDRIAHGAQRPLSAYARAEDIDLVGHTPLATRFEVSPEHYARGLSRELLFLPVRGTGAELDQYTLALQALGRRWFDAFPELGDELRQARGLSESVALVDARYGFDERDAYAAFGPWLPALFAEAVLGLRFGDAYVTALRHQVVRSGPVALRAFAHGRALGAEPPLIVRMHAALSALEALGRSEEVAHHRALLERALPGAEQIHVPVASGQYVVLPSAFMLPLAEELARALLETRLDALGGMPLLEWPGLAQTLEAAREQASLSRALLPGVGRNTDAAQLLGAAWLAADQHEDASVVIALRRALSPQAEVAKKAAAGTAPRPPRSLHAAFRDRRTLQRAILLGAALAPPRGRRGRA